MRITSKLLAAVVPLVLFAGIALPSPAHADPTPECNNGPGTFSTECGAFSSAIGSSATAVGVGSNASGDFSTATGRGSDATGDRSSAMGVGSDASGDNSTALGADSTASADGSVALGQGSVADRENSVSVGSAGAERQIVNVAAGTAATDAVNLGQLTTTNSAVTAIQAVNTTQGGQISALQVADLAFTSRLDNLSFDLNRDRRDARAGTASALAAAGLPQASGEGRTMIAGGVGTYRGRHAFAIGASHRLQGGNGTFKVGLTYDSEKHVGANGGFGFEF